MDGLSVLRCDKLSSELGLHLKAAIKKFSNNFNRITKSNTIITLKLNLVQFKKRTSYLHVHIVSKRKSLG